MFKQSELIGFVRDALADAAETDGEFAYDRRRLRLRRRRQVQGRDAALDAQARLARAAGQLRDVLRVEEAPLKEFGRRRFERFIEEWLK